MSTDTEAYRELFLEESQVQLQEWESALLGLEKAPDDRALLDTLFRAIHTLKGSSGFVGCTELQSFLHELESAVQPVRDGARALAPAMIEALLEGLDNARALIDAYAHSRPLTVDAAGVLSRLREPAAKKRLYRIALEVTSPARERYMRSLLVQSRVEEVATVVTLNPSLEELRLQDGDFRYEMVVETEGRREEIARVLDVDQVIVHRLDEMPEVGAPPAAPQETHHKTAAAATGAETAAPLSLGALRKDGVIRVPVGKLDALMNLVGELVVQNSGFISIAGELAGSYGRNRLVSLLSERTEMLSRVARQLQDSVMKVRMLPVATVFDRFTRVVRDLARSLDKEVVMKTYGDETEIDKKVIDRIADPLVHLIRNAVDHGLENAEGRRAAGKDPVGRVTLGAYQEANHICIEISDDGRGLDRDKIVATAVRKGLMSAAEAEKMSPEEALQLVFLPGFSTAERVTDVSGRGVGMDVVKRTVEELDGTVSLASTPGTGTKVTITLPLTMAIIRAIMVQESGILFAIPLSSVNEIVKLDAAAYQTLCEESVIHLRDAFVPVVNLAELLGLKTAASAGNGGGSPGANGGARPVVIVTYEGKKIGVAAERLEGNSEIVIKSLARNYREIDGLVGASILGNGRIALILDMKGLMDIHLHKKAPRVGVREKQISPVALTPAASSMAAAPAPSPAAPPALEPAAAESAEYRGAESAEYRGAESAEYRGAAAPPPEPAPATAVDEGIRDLVEGRLKERMEDIYNASAIEASQAMTRLMGRDIQVSFPETSAAPIGGISEMLGGEEAAVARIYVGIQGDIKGGCLFVVTLEEALRLCDILLRREAGTTRTIGEEEGSALSETGNILCASFVNAVADGSGLTAVSEVPDLCVDMCQAAIDPVLARFNQRGSTLLVTRTELFAEESERAVSNLLVFIDQGSFPALRAAFAARDGKPGERR